MVLRIALILLIAVGLAGFGVVGWLVLNQGGTQPEQAAAPVVAPVNSLTAARSLPIGTILLDTDFAVQAVAATTLPPGAEIDSPATRIRLTGAMVQRALVAGQAITLTDLFTGQHGAIAILLRPGMRATTIAVDAVSGGAGLLAPGDHVDVLLTQVRPDGAAPAGHKVSAELLLSDLRVIAVDQRLRQGAAADPKDVPVPHTVTLESSDVQAQRLNVAAQLGHLDLIVRPAVADAKSQAAIADATMADPPPLGPVVWSNDASQTFGNAAVAAGSTVHVFRGPADDKEFRF